MGEDPASIRGMFSQIAPRYDLLNHVLSFGTDRRWRRRACQQATVRRGARVLDICSGTGDFALECLAQHPRLGQICLTDFAEPMLSIARSKADGVAAAAITYGCAEALRLPYRAEAFDLVLCAFGIRNLPDVDAGLREFRRVTRVGGQLVIVEFCAHPMPWYAWPGRVWMRYVLPTVGRLVSRHPSAYTYLPTSRDAFSSPAEMKQHLEAAGYDEVRYELLTFGVATLFVARR